MGFLTLDIEKSNIYFTNKLKASMIDEQPIILFIATQKVMINYDCDQNL